jgi:hypothetical protein
MHVYLLSAYLSISEIYAYLEFLLVSQCFYATNKWKSYKIQEKNFNPIHAILIRPKTKFFWYKVQKKVWKLQ